MSEISVVAQAYLDGWKRKDAGVIAAQLHPEVAFFGPLTKFEGCDAVMQSFHPLLPMINDVIVRHLFVDDERVMMAYDFVCAEPVGSIRIAELLGFENGQIRSIELFFDPRPFLSAMHA